MEVISIEYTIEKIPDIDIDLQLHAKFVPVESSSDCLRSTCNDYKLVK